jgi:hypothetical protein
MRRTESNVRVIPGIHTRDRAALRFREGKTKKSTGTGRPRGAGVHKLLVLRDLHEALVEASAALILSAAVTIAMSVRYLLISISTSCCSSASATMIALMCSYALFHRGPWFVSSGVIACATSSAIVSST